MRFSRVCCSVLSVFIFAGVNAHAANDEKSHYTVFRPTPKDKMRELSTDRPDKTESAYTLDAGHFQVESDIYFLAQDKQAAQGVETKTTSSAILNSNIKMGLTNSTDLQIVFAPIEKEEQSVTGQATESKSGFSDTLIRLKMNLIGNDGGDYAIALMPYVKIPTNTGDLGNKVVDGGLIIPIALNLPQDWGLGLMMQFDRIKNDSDDNFHTEYVSSATMSHDIVGELGGYFEFYSWSSGETGAPWVATWDMGLTYGLTPDIQLDLGANIGLNDAADDLETFVGASARF